MIRSCLIGLFLALAGAACSGSSEAPAGSSSQVAEGQTPSSAGEYRNVRRLAEGVYTYEYAPAGDPVTTVSMFVVTAEGVLVADGQGTPAETGRLLEAIAEVTDAPVTHVVVCSDHGDHTGGNRAFPEGVEFLAHPAARAAMEASAQRSDRPAGTPPTPLPSRLVDDRVAFRLGGRDIEVRFLGRGHTAGDLVVLLPAEGIAFMSEAYNDRVFPLLRAGYPSEWVGVLRQAEAMDSSIYVAGHGVRGSIEYGRQGVVRFREAVELVIAEATRLHAGGLSAEEAVALAEFGALTQQADYSAQAARAVQRVYMELNGALPPVEPR